MGDLAEKLLAKTTKEYAAILGLNCNPEDAANILRQQSPSSLLKGIKEFHDSIHSFDGTGRSEFISELITDGMHDEQVWQQQEVQMDALKRYLHREFMYSDFFDPPRAGDDSQQAMATQSGEESEENEGEESEENEGEESEEKESDEEEDMETDSDEDRPKKVRFSDSAKTADKQGNEKHSLSSSFEKRTEKLRRQIQALEEKSIAEKPWQLAGEVGAGDRPENSMLEEHVDFKQAPPAAAEMTEERSKSIEEIILQRVKDKSFDDNQRQVRPVEEAFELKMERTLDQEKSKLSLHEVYEQEFLKLQTPEDEEKTNPVHDEIKKMMSDLFPRLDALASWHYTPIQAVPELRVKNNLPSLRMEEPTPITMSSAAAMAPEEIQDKKSKKTMSSKTFFSQLQEEVTSQTTTKAKKKLKQKSSDKLLL